MSGNGKSGLFGNPERVAVERGLAEFRSGRPVVMTAAGEVVMVLPVDGMTAEQLASVRLLCSPAKPYLLVTARRARALGIEAAGPVGIAIGDLDSASDIFSFAADTQVTRHLDVVPAGPGAVAASSLPSSPAASAALPTAGHRQ
jgi:GTP cyclohydrolase II